MRQGMQITSPGSRRNAALKRPDIEPPMMIARGALRLYAVAAYCRQ